MSNNGKASEYNGWVNKKGEKGSPRDWNGPGSRSHPLNVDNTANTSHNFVGTNHESLAGGYILPSTTAHGGSSANQPKNSKARSNSTGHAGNSNATNSPHHSGLSRSSVSGQNLNKSSSPHNAILAQSHNHLHNSPGSLGMTLGMNNLGKNDDGHSRLANINHIGMHPLRYMPLSMYANLARSAPGVSGSAAATLSELEALNCYEDLLSASAPSSGAPGSAAASYLNSPNFTASAAAAYRARNLASFSSPTNHPLYDPLAMDTHFRMKAYSAAHQAAQAQAQVQAAQQAAQAHHISQARAAAAQAAQQARTQAVAAAAAVSAAASTQSLLAAAASSQQNLGPRKNSSSEFLHLKEGSSPSNGSRNNSGLNASGGSTASAPSSMSKAAVGNINGNVNVNVNSNGIPASKVNSTAAAVRLSTNIGFSGVARSSSPSPQVVNLMAAKDYENAQKQSNNNHYNKMTSATSSSSASALAASITANARKNRLLPTAKSKQKNVGPSSPSGHGHSSSSPGSKHKNSNNIVQVVTLENGQHVIHKQPQSSNGGGGTGRPSSSSPHPPPSPSNTPSSKQQSHHITMGHGPGGRLTYFSPNHPQSFHHADRVTVVGPASAGGPRPIPSKSAVGPSPHPYMGMSMGMGGMGGPGGPGGMGGGLPKFKKPRKPRGPNKKKKLPLSLNSSSSQSKPADVTSLDDSTFDLITTPSSSKDGGTKNAESSHHHHSKDNNNGNHTDNDSKDDNINLHLPPPPTEIQPWFSSHTPLGSDQDKYWLSELQCYIRSNIVEAFGATARDVAVLRCGRSKPISLGQVGIRCMFCRDVYPVSERGQQAVSYPGLIQGIYNSVQQMLRAHFETCTRIPHDVRQTVESLRASTSARGGRKQYWEDSARRLGLIDTRKGIYYSWDPKKPMPEEFRDKIILQNMGRHQLIDAEQAERMGVRSLTSPTSESIATTPGGAAGAIGAGVGASGGASGGGGGTAMTDGSIRSSSDGKLDVTSTTPTNLGSEIGAESSSKGASGGGGGDVGGEMVPILPTKLTENNPALMLEDDYDLVLPDDEPLISDYLYLALRQMKPCLLNNADLVGCYKDRETGFRGLACKHCIGQAGCGRYFPASEASLSQTTTSHTIFNHVRNCRRVPIEIRSELEMMKRGKLGPDGKKIKPKHGGRKVFFHRLWCRIQGLKIIEEEDVMQDKKKKKKQEDEEKARKRALAVAKKKKDKMEKDRLAKLAKSNSNSKNTDDSFAGRRRLRKKTLKATRTSNRKPKKKTFDDHVTQGSDEDGDADNESYNPHSHHKHNSSRSRKNRKAKLRKPKSSKKRRRKMSDDSTVTEFSSDEDDYNRINSDDDVTNSSMGSRSRSRKRDRDDRDSSSDSETSSSNSDGTGTLDETDSGSETESNDESLTDKDDKDKDDVDIDDEETSITSEDEEDDDEVWFNGTVSLMKQDDPYWLSEVQCYVRSDMIEVFSATEEDVKARGRHIFVGLGNVGLRCVYCSNASSHKRPKGHIIFPSKLSAVHQAVNDLQRRHFSSCPEMPRNIRETYKSMRGFTTKEDDETQQYWIDAAKDLGLANSPHGGVIFKRDPSLPSLADTLHDYDKKDKDAAGDNSSLSMCESTSGLIRRKDKQLITDFYLFLFQQVVPSLFREKDRRKGAGLRRDYEIGFPGLQCRHCARKSNNGRYFPFSPKSLADNTTHSLFIHIQGCKNCPEMIKSSLAYLTHRSLLQKNELKRGWKRDLFQKVWDRLHDKESWVGGKFIIPPDDEDDTTNSSTNLTADESSEIDGKDDDDNISVMAQILHDLENKERQESSESESDVDSEDLGSDVGDAIQGLYPRRSKRRRNPPQSPVLTRARRSCSLIIRGDTSSRVTRKRRRVNAG